MTTIVLIFIGVGVWISGICIDHDLGRIVAALEAIERKMK